VLLNKKAPTIEQFERLKVNFLAKKEQYNNLKRENIKKLRQLTIQKKRRDQWVIAREIFTEAAKITQQNTADMLSSSVSLVLAAIPTDQPLKFIAKFETRRNQPELDFFLQEGKQQAVPLLPTVDTVGGSAEEIISLASMLFLWSIQMERTAPVQFYDEPFRTLAKPNLNEAMKLVNELQSALGIQMIITTHAEEIYQTAGRTYFITKKEDKAIVEKIE